MNGTCAYAPVTFNGVALGSWFDGNTSRKMVNRLGLQLSTGLLSHACADRVWPETGAARAELNNNNTPEHGTKSGWCPRRSDRGRRRRSSWRSAVLAMAER
jgi:hypothetical protein